MAGIAHGPMHTTFHLMQSIKPDKIVDSRINLYICSEVDYLRLIMQIHPVGPIQGSVGSPEGWQTRIMFVYCVYPTDCRLTVPGT